MSIESDPTQIFIRNWEIYQKTIAEKFYYEKKLIVKELEQYGIQALLTSPQQLSINTINKYLMLKAKGAI